MTVTNPGSKSGTVGTAIASFTLSATGGTTPYTWSATGLPPGVTIGSSTGTVSGTPTTAGTYNVTATATGSGGSGSGSTSFTFTIGGGGGGCSGQRLGNPGFETGSAAPWSASAGVVDNTASQPAHSGSWKAWLDGYGSTHTDTLSQSVSIPAGLRRDAVVLPARRLRGDHDLDRLRQADGQDRVDDAGDVQQPQQGVGLHAALVQRLVLRGPDGDGQLHRCRGLLSPDVVRHRRHGAEPQLSLTH